MKPALARICILLLASTSKEALFAQHTERPANTPARSSLICDTALAETDARGPELSRLSAASVKQKRTVIDCALQYRHEGEYEHALALLLRANRLLAGDPELLRDTALLEDEMHLYQDADVAIAAALKLSPDDPTGLYTQARIKMDLQQVTPAEAAMKQYLGLRPNDASAYYGLGRMYRAEFRNEEAIAAFRQSLALAPHQAESNFQLGELAEKNNDVDQANRFFDAALQVDPRHAGALTGKAILAYRQKDYARAEQLLLNAEQSAPGYDIAHYYAGLVLARLGLQAESEAELKLAVKLAEDAKKLSNLHLAAPSQ